MVGVLEDLSSELEQGLSLYIPSEVLVWGDREFRIYEDKAAAALLSDHGFLNVGIGPLGGPTDKALSLQKFSETDLGFGFQDKKKEIVISDVVGFSLHEQELRLFHWNGFASTIDLAKFTLIDQYMSK